MSGVLNVRQIGNYPQTSDTFPADLALIQQGGLGGPYASISTQVLMERGLAHGGNLVMADASGISWAGGSSVSANGNQIEFVGQASFSYLEAELITINGVTAADQVWVGNQIATLQATLNFELTDLAINNVRSWNGRIGNVVLQERDINWALGISDGDDVASQSWVKAILSSSLNTFYNSCPLVYSFNGRTGAVTLTLADIEAEFFAGPLPTAPTAAPGDKSETIATTAFVANAVSGSFLPLTGGTLTGDLTILEPQANLNIASTSQYAALSMCGVAGGGCELDAYAAGGITASGFNFAKWRWAWNWVDGGAEPGGNVGSNFQLFRRDDSGNPIAADGGLPILLARRSTGVFEFRYSPTAPTLAQSDSSTNLATTAFVHNAVVASTTGVASFNTRTGAITLTTADVTGAGGAPIASPNFTGTPSGPTAAPGTSNTQLATTAFVAASLVGAGVTSFNTRSGAVTLLAADVSSAGGALVSSPTFTGVPSAPTAAVNTSTTQIATTAYVTGQASTTLPLAAGVAAVGVATTFARADHVHPAPVLRSYLAGLALSTAGASASFSVAPGTAADSTNVSMISLASAVSKTTAAWVAGSGNGSLDTGVIAASTWYHVFVILRTDTGVSGVLTSLSVSAPSLPAGYTLFRRIGSMKTDASSHWTKFIQTGDVFQWDSAAIDANNIAVTNVNHPLTLSVPPGLKVMALISGWAYSTTVDATVFIWDPDISGNPNSAALTLVPTNNSAGSFNVQNMTNASAQVVLFASAAVSSLDLYTSGWIDRRGRDS